MSQKALVEFMAKSEQDPELMAQAKGVIENTDSPDQFVALGKQHGFDFTGKEVVQFFSKMDNEELSEADLEAVAGGTSFSVASFSSLSVPRSWFSIGRLGAAMHDAFPGM